MIDKEGFSIKRSYLVSLFFAMSLLLVNNSYLFPTFYNDLEIYLSLVLGVNLITVTLLSNAAYYHSRIRIDTIYIAISTYLFILMVNLLGALMWLLILSYENWQIMSLILSMGKLYFVFGIATLEFQRRLPGWFTSFPKLSIMGIGYLIFEVIMIRISLLGFFDLNSLMFLINGGAVICLVIICYDYILRHDVVNQFAYLFAFTTMLVGQMLLTLMPLSITMQIQSLILFGFGFSYYYFYLNQSNLLIPYEAQKTLQTQFNLYAVNLKKIIDKKTYQMREANQKFIDELDYAKMIQQSLLPKGKVQYRDSVFISEFFPCERLSGDFFDHYRVDEDNVAFYLMDVSGHGIPAALVTMFSGNHLRSNDKNLQRYFGLKPDQVLTQFYNEFNKMNFPDEMHMVLIYATMNLSTKMLTYCSAGLNCSPIRLKKNGKIELLDKSEGFPICKLLDEVEVEFKSERIKLDKGDRLLFFTDGLIDNKKNNTYHYDELIELLQTHQHYSMEALNALIVERIKPFKHELNDDITYILLEV